MKALLLLFTVLIASCANTDTADKTVKSFTVKGEKITVVGNLNAGAKITAAQAQQAVEISVKLLESGN